jgi:hypothetical protein
LSNFLRLRYWQYNSFAHIVQMATLVRQGPFGGVAGESPQGRKPIMGIFDKIKHAIFGGPASAAQAAPTTGAAASTTAAAPSASAATPAASSSSASAPATAAPAAPSAPASIDVTAILDQAVAKSGQKLDWRHSIVDLMKALKMDATLAERKELATELHYAGDMQDSAAMNIWLHKALMKKLAENGGKVPADLTD